MNRRTAPELHAITFDSPDALRHAAHRVRDLSQIRQWMSIATCQRNELYLLFEPESVPRDADGTGRPSTIPNAGLLDQAVGHVEGGDATLRLFQIAAGVLSHVPGERAVAEQLRSQLRIALRCGEAGSTMAMLVRRALEAGHALRSRVERETPILELADLAARFSCDLGNRPVTLLGRGALGRSIHEALRCHGIRIKRWGTRSPQRITSCAEPVCSLDDALGSLEDNALLITALSGGGVIDARSLPANAMAIDLGEPANIYVPGDGAPSPVHTGRAIIASCATALSPQSEAVRRAAHRLAAKANAALAETICPDMSEVNRAIARFRDQIVDAELKRLGADLQSMPREMADRLSRSIRHTAARCVHPLHDYVNALGRQGRSNEAQLVVDHLLGSRIGFTAPAEAAASSESTPDEHQPHQAT